MKHLPLVAVFAGTLCFGSGCIQLRAPVEPIRIDLNVRIDQEVRVRLDDDVNDLITTNPDLF